METQKELIFPTPALAIRQAAADSALTKIIGNPNAKKKVRRPMIVCQERINHVMSDQNMCFVGPAGTGKSTFPKVINTVADLPFVEIVAGSVSSVEDVVQRMKKACADYDNGVPKNFLKIVPWCGDPKKLLIPPMIVFIDEVHDLCDDVVQGLLTATEKTQRFMQLKDGTHVNTRNVCWMIATTERGELFDPFDTRFTKIKLGLLGVNDMAKLIQAYCPDFPSTVCWFVARYASRIPREAKDFCDEMRLQMSADPSTWEKIVHIVAQDNEIELIPTGNDRFRPMTMQRLNILKTLALKGPMGAERLAVRIGVKEKELKKYTLPWLVEGVEGEEPMVTSSSRGCQITEAGVKELVCRGLPYNILKVAC